MQPIQRRRIHLLALVATAQLLSGCAIAMRGATVVEVEVNGFIALQGGSNGDETKPLVNRPRTDRSLVQSPVSEAVIGGLLVRVGSMSNIAGSMSMTNQSDAPMLIRLKEGTMRFSADSALTPIGDVPTYVLFSISGGVLSEVRDNRAQSPDKSITLAPNHMLAYSFTSKQSRVGERYIQNFGISIDQERSLITHSSVGHSMTASIPVEIKGEKLVLELAIKSVKEYQRQSYY